MHTPYWLLSRLSPGNLVWLVRSFPVLLRVPIHQLFPMWSRLFPSPPPNHPQQTSSNSLIANSRPTHHSSTNQNNVPAPQNPTMHSLRTTTIYFWSPLSFRPVHCISHVILKSRRCSTIKRNSHPANKQTDQTNARTPHLPSPTLHKIVQLV